jgi:hypothetical protein
MHKRGTAPLANSHLTHSKGQGNGRFKPPIAMAPPTISLSEYCEAV